jgi:hypothetical protein
MIFARRGTCPSPYHRTTITDLLDHVGGLEWSLRRPRAWMSAVSAVVDRSASWIASWKAGMPVTSYRPALRRLLAYAMDAFRQGLSAANARHAELRPADPVRYDASTLYFEADADN